MNEAGITLIDSHAHLDFPHFEGQLDAVLERARAAGVAKILTIGTSLEAARASIESAARYPGVYAAAGIHPNYVAEKGGGFPALKRLFDDAPLVAVGETGLDFYRDHTPREDQERAFREHIELSLERDLPLIIHVRDAYRRALEVIDSAQAMPRGVFHCYSGDEAFAREAVARGFYVSFAGQLTFANASSLRGVAAALPLDRLLVETDCPYLAPMPHRGKTNEPAFVRFTAQTLAEVQGVAFEEAARATTRNAERLFAF